MRHHIHTTSHEAYLHALEDVWENPDFESAPRGLPVREVMDYAFTILNPTSEPLITQDEARNSVIADYTAKEVALYDSCSNRVEDFAAASKFWNHIANPDGTINSAYGHLIWENKSCGNPIYEAGADDLTNNPEKAPNYMRTPWEWCKQSLIQDKDSRQAVLRFSLPWHQWQGNKDQTCTMHGNFLIRDDKLNLSVIMRSNDLMKGLVYDLPWFCSLMDRMVGDLRTEYPDLEKGEYTHLSHSMHIYEKDKEAIFKMLGS